jgi:hypothetical protein
MIQEVGEGLFFIGSAVGVFVFGIALGLIGRSVGRERRSDH